MRCLYMIIERDPEHAWLVVGSERREIELGDGVNFHDWARTQSMAPNVELKFLCEVSDREGRRPASEGCLSRSSR
jgi:hypothetical protein